MSFRKLKSDIWQDFLAISVKKHSAPYFLACLLTRSGFLAVVLYRLAALTADQPNVLSKIATSFFWRLNIFLNNCDISPRAEIGPGLKMPHPIGIVVGHAHIGNNVMLLQNCTLGMRWFTDDENDPKNYPRLGDNTIVCSGAQVLGAVTVGHDAVIGANAVVTKDVPDNHTAVGIPADIFPRVHALALSA